MNKFDMGWMHQENKSVFQTVNNLLHLWIPKYNIS